MSDEADTPPGHLRALGHGGEAVSYADLVALMWDMRRELQKEIRAARLEQAEAMTEIRTRRTWIEGRLAEGTAMNSKHDDQIIELIDQSVSLERRVEKIEKATAAADAIAADRQNSLPKRMVSAAAIGAAGMLGPLAIGWVLWLLAAYVKAGTPMPAGAGGGAGADDVRSVRPASTP